MSVTTAPTPPTIRGVEPTSARVTYWQRFTMVFIVVVPLAGVVGGLWWGYGRGVSGVDIGLFLGFYVLTCLGVTVGYHRLLTHKSFRAPAWVRAGFAVAGSLAIQGAAIDWVATHRRHHAYADEVGDPHSPHVDAGDGLLGMLRGLWHAHVGWMFRGETTLQETWAPDLLEEPAIRAISRGFGWFVLASFALPAVLGGLLTMSWAGAVTGLVWGGLARIFLLHHVTWSINSVCHVFGTRPFESHDESRNNLPMALLGFGEGWHNAHHAFPASARHGLRWWELDISYLVIRTLQALGLAKDVKLPSATQMARRSRARVDG